MKKFQRLFIAMGLAMSMMLGAISPTILAVADEVEPADLVYVALGDSMTTGYGLEKGKKSYPVIVEEDMIEKGYTVDARDLSDNGMRLEELRYLLEYGQSNGYKGDAITATYKYTADDAKKYKDAVKEADYISLALGSNNFMRSFAKQTLGLIGDLAGLEDSSIIGGTNYEINTNGSGILDGIIDGLYDQLETAVIDMIEQALGITISGSFEYMDIVKKFTGNLSYAVNGIMTHYNACLDAILKANSDVNLVLVSIPNVMSGTALTFDLKDVEIGEDNAKDLLDSITIGPIKISSIIDYVGTKVTFDFGNILEILIGNTNTYLNTLVTNYNTRKILNFRRYKLSIVNIRNVDSIGNHFDENIDMIRDDLLQNYENVLTLPAQIINNNKYIPASVKELIPERIMDFLNSLESICIKEHANLLECYEAFVNDVDGVASAAIVLNDPTAFDREALAMAVFTAIEKLLVLGAGQNEIEVNTLMQEFQTMGDFFANFGNPETYTYQDLSNDIIRLFAGKDASFTAVPGLISYIVKLTACDSWGVHPSEKGHQEYAEAISKRFNIKQKEAPVVNPIIETVTNVVNTVVNTVTSTVTVVVNTVRTSITRIFNLFRPRVW